MPGSWIRLLGPPPTHHSFQSFNNKINVTTAVDAVQIGQFFQTLEQDSVQGSVSQDSVSQDSVLTATQTAVQKTVATTDTIPKKRESEAPVLLDEKIDVNEVARWLVAERALYHSIPNVLLCPPLITQSLCAAIKRATFAKPEQNIQIIPSIQYTQNDLHVIPYHKRSDDEESLQLKYLLLVVLGLIVISSTITFIAMLPTPVNNRSSQFKFAVPSTGSSLATLKDDVEVKKSMDVLLKGDDALIGTTAEAAAAAAAAAEVKTTMDLILRRQREQRWGATVRNQTLDDLRALAVDAVALKRREEEASFVDRIYGQGWFKSFRLNAVFERSLSLATDDLKTVLEHIKEDYPNVPKLQALTADRLLARGSEYRMLIDDFVSSDDPTNNTQVGQHVSQTVGRLWFLRGSETNPRHHLWIANVGLSYSLKSTVQTTENVSCLIAKEVKPSADYYLSWDLRYFIPCLWSAKYCDHIEMVEGLCEKQKTIVPQEMLLMEPLFAKIETKLHSVLTGYVLPVAERVMSGLELPSDEPSHVKLQLPNTNNSSQ